MALTDRQAKGLQPGDKAVFDGKVTGLMLTPGKTGSKWTLRSTSPITGKRRDAGLGVYPEVTIADAREKALAMRKVLSAEQWNKLREIQRHHAMMGRMGGHMMPGMGEHRMEPRRPAPPQQ